MPIAGTTTRYHSGDDPETLTEVANIADASFKGNARNGNHVTRLIEKINRIEQGMVVSFEGRQVEYDFGDLDELALAYVLSIHKSQGSEFSCRSFPSTPSTT